MIKQIKQKVRYEFYNFENSAIGNVAQFNLKLEDPASVKFEFVSFLPGTQIATINKIYNLDSILNTNNGTAVFPSQLILENNSDEIDSTIYSIVIFSPGTVYVTCKYYIKD